MKHSFSLWKFFSDIRYGNMPFKLGEGTWHKYKLKADLLTKSAMNLMFWDFLATTWLLLFGSSMVAYFDHDQCFSLTSIILWSLLTMFGLSIFYSTYIVVFISWYLVALYLKSKFKEINNDIEESLNQSNSWLLVNAMIEHNLVTKKLVELNEFFKFFLYSNIYLLLWRDSGYSSYGLHNSCEGHHICNESGFSPYCDLFVWRHFTHESVECFRAKLCA